MGRSATYLLSLSMQQWPLSTVLVRYSNSSMRMALPVRVRVRVRVDVTTGAAATNFWIDPEEDLVVIMMTQVMMLNSLRPRMALRPMMQILSYGAIVDDRPRAGAVASL